ncbi:peptide-methionine (S)-S-oxide reductase MsrA [Rosenbergiella australiborealis]|uniref:peptide-methionine (S)-S-oxide reductase MsrA n=1 Tax=Rosenbergiella australiborealis TaxID=1544696 RepID=UPI001F4E7995|nr:peptide-methionine (S)-S-oxide reductase MsrA [Rosenbergiella australiborealis]
MATDYAIIAGGCFWCTEAVFQSLKGVLSVESGYTGGASAHPTYEQVCSGTTGHAEAIRIGFDPQLISYDDLLDVSFATHDPTQLNRQGNDIGTQYRSAIFPLNASQQRSAEQAIERAQQDHAQPIVTTIEAFIEWYPAEEYHQNYWDRVGENNGFCMAVIPPKLQKLRKKFADRVKD